MKIEKGTVVFASEMKFPFYIAGVVYSVEEAKQLLADLKEVIEQSEV